MDFFFFLLVNAALFIRPGELIPATEGWPIYNVVIVMNLLVAAPAIVSQFTEDSLSRSPITVCVLGTFCFLIISQLVRIDLEKAATGGTEFAKVVAYFLLIMATVNTPRRLFKLMGAVVAFTLIVNVIAVLHYHNLIQLPSLNVVMTGGAARMCGTGIFGDPNDLSMIIVVSILICVGGLFYRQFGLVRILLVAPIGFLGYALTLTQSRGGLLALLAGCGAFLYARFGIVRAGVLGAAVFPVLLVGFGGRQSDFSGAINSGTGRSRVELWSDGLEAFKASPVFGVGYKLYPDYASGRVAHNSFVEAFVELGFLGGMTFLGIFAIAGWSLWKMRRVQQEIAHPGLRYLLPFVIAMLVAYCMSMMSLSRYYTVATYLIAGIAATFERLAQPGTSHRPVQLNGMTLTALGMASVGFLVAVHLYIKLLFRLG